jgi:soluble lytic murein transglycosylase
VRGKPPLRYNGAMRRRWLPFLLLATASHAGAQTPESVPTLVRAGLWAEADAAASLYPDPIARTLVQYERLLAPGAATAGEIAAFVRNSNGWPHGALLRRLDEALATEADDAAALPLCEERRPEQPTARLRCAAAFLHAGRTTDAAQLARETWIESPLDPGQEVQVLRDWSTAIAPGDHWARFERLAWTDSGRPGGAAARQTSRLAPSDRIAAAARLALLHDDPSAPALLAKLAPAMRQDPGTILALLRWMRRTGQAVTAAAMWPSAGDAAERAAPEERRGLFSHERESLARELLGAGDPVRAVAVATAGLPTVDSEFLAGWISLQRLDLPADAARHFTTLASLSPAAITQARSHYWLGRARAAQGDAPGAREAFTAAAAWLTAFYGQLADRAAGGSAQRLADDLRSLRDPDWTSAQAASLSGGDRARAALLLVAWGEPGRARAYLNALADGAADAAGWSFAAHLALGLDMPDAAVAIARRAGLRGIMLPEAGWPAPYPVPGVTPGAAVALGVMRQESSFDPSALSPAGALGLMQLMPATAAAVARSLTPAQGSDALPASLTDPRLNIQLGTAYLAGLLTQFQGALPVALAAYNAGPNRAQSWLAGRDPAALDIVDWIEMIPFDETRNYVQRCIEGIMIYAARQGQASTDPLAPWLG